MGGSPSKTGQQTHKIYTYRKESPIRKEVIKAERLQTLEPGSSEKRRKSYQHFSAENSQLQLSWIQGQKMYVRQSIAVTQQLGRVFNNLKRRKLLSTGQFSEIRKQNDRQSLRNQVTYKNLQGKEKNIKSKNNLLVQRDSYVSRNYHQKSIEI